MNKRKLIHAQIVEMLENDETDFSNSMITDFNARELLIETPLNFENSILKNVNLSSFDIEGSNFKGATLEHCNLEGNGFCNCDFTNANLSHVKFAGHMNVFYGAKFVNAHMDHVTISDADNTTHNAETGEYGEGEPIDFSGATITNCRFAYNEMPNTSFEGATIKDSQLFDNELSGSNYKNLTVENVKVKDSENTSSTKEATNKWLAEVQAQNIELTDDDLKFANEQFSNLSV